MHIQRPLEMCYSLNQRQTFTHIEAILIEKVVILETQYAKMENDYLKKIKQLKNNLRDKIKKQMSLSSQINNLRQQCKGHQEEIAKISLEFIEKPQRKINNSPRILKKSTQTIRKMEKKESPSNYINNSATLTTTHLKNSNMNILNPCANFIPDKQLQASIGQQQTLKKPQKFEHFYQIRNKNIFERQKEKAKLQAQITSKSPKQSKPTSNSPKQGSHKYLKGFLVSSMKKLINSKPGMPTIQTNSPKRIIRVSPTDKNEASKKEVKKEEKKLLGKMKETLEAF